MTRVFVQSSIIRFLLLSAVLIAFACPYAFAATLSRDELVAVYIFRLAEHIRWPNAAKISSYYIHVIHENNNIETQLNKIGELKSLHGKPIKTSTSTGLDIPQDTHLIFLGKKFNHLYPSLFRRVRHKNILLISDNLVDKRTMMLNLSDRVGDKISFEINKTNIINQNLGMDPDIILLGGTEIDVAKLFREGQLDLQKAQHELNQVKIDIEKIRTERQELLHTIGDQKTELVELKQTTTEQHQKIAAQTELLNLTNEKLQQQQNQYTALLHQTKAQQEYIKQQITELDNRNRQLNKQQEQIAQRRVILDSQQAEIDLQTVTISEQGALIARQQQTITSQEAGLAERGHTIEVQRNYLLLSVTTGGLFLILVIVTYRGNRKNTKINIKLTEQRDLLEHTAKELNVAKQEADLANQAKSTFLANMSHELRTPLNAVLGFTELMRRDPHTNEQQRRNLEIVNRSGQHLLAMINDVLDLSKIEAGKVKLEAEDFSLIQNLNDISDMIRVRAESKGLKYSLNMEEGLPNHIKMDGSKIRQVLLNLLNNATKFTDTGSISLNVSCNRESIPPVLNFKVSDTGVGIAEGELENIFSPFVQADHPDIKRMGTGLGLAISCQFVQLMGGELKVHSRLGSGSTFYFSIPAEEIYPEEVKILEKPKDVDRLAEDQKKWRILVVEDQLESRLLLHSLLASVGFDVKTAANAIEGISIYTHWQPHLIWMDLRMPHMDGSEATRRIRELSGGSQVKILALTASVFTSKRSDIIEAGFDDMLYKPFESHKLFELMQKHLGVKYLYKSVIQQETPASVATIEEQFSSLPVALLADLLKAAKRLDQKSLEQLLNTNLTDQPELRQSILSLVGEFRYDKIIHLCEHALHLQKEPS